MRTRFTPLLAVALLASAGVSAQDTPRIVNIPQSQDANTIRNFIEADLAASDTATVASTIYTLDRDGLYLYNGQWQPEYSVNIAAAEGEGARPIIVSENVEGEASRWMRSVAAYTLTGLYISSVDVGGEQTDNAPLRPRGNGTTVRFENNVLNDQRFEILRTDATNLTVYMIDNIVPRNYQRDLWYKNGGLWFQRGNALDSMIFRGNTYYDTPARFTHSINGAPIEYLEFTNNTIHNVGGMAELNQYGGLPLAVLDLGISINCVVQNNIMHNVGFMGVDSGDVDQIGIFNWYPLDQVALDTFGFPGGQTLTITNNNLYTDPDLLANTPDTAQNIPLFSAQLDSFYALRGDGSMTNMEMFMQENIAEPLTFTNVPDNKQLFIDAKISRWADPATASNEVLILNSFIPEGSVYEDIPQLDFSYAEDAESYSAATDGGPLGARRWFPNFDPADTTDSRAIDFGSPELASLELAPNPAITSATLTFDLPSTAEVSINVYDVSGEMITGQAVGVFGQGRGHSVAVDVATLPRGVYAVTLIAETQEGRIGAVRRLIKQ